MDIILIPLIQLIISSLSIVEWIIIASIICDWLVFFNIININNNFIMTIIAFMQRFSSFFLDPIRKILPSIYGLDLSPIIFILIVSFTKNVLFRFILKFA